MGSWVGLRKDGPVVGECDFFFFNVHWAYYQEWKLLLHYL